MLASFNACSSDEVGEGGDDDSSVSSSSSSSSSGKSSSSGRNGSSSSSSGSSSSSSSGGSSSSSSSGGSSSSGDAAVDEQCSDGGAANLDGGSVCGSHAFRRPPAQFAPADPSIGQYEGGVPGAGIYDAVAVGTLLTGGTWQETLVLDGVARPGADGAAGVPGRFTRTRQVKTSANGALGPLAQRSGTYTLSGTNIDFVDDCASIDGEPAELDSMSVPYTAYVDECGLSAIHYGGPVVITLRQH